MDFNFIANITINVILIIVCIIGIINTIRNNKRLNEFNESDPGIVIEEKENNIQI